MLTLHIHYSPQKKETVEITGRDPLDDSFLAAILLFPGMLYLITLFLVVVCTHFKIE